MTPARALRRAAAKEEWFASWFDSVHYQKLYAHRDRAEAAAFLDRLVAALGPRPGARVLDVGCGTGRHATYLASRGFDVTGIDLSPASIHQAKRGERSNLRFLRQDMRFPFRLAAVEYILSLFTSFGYFEDPAEHVTVIHNMATALAAGGRVVLDYLNVDYVERHLTAEEEIRLDDTTYGISRWTGRDAIFKRIRVRTPGAAAPVEHVERVARLSLEDFEFMFTLCDMTIEAVYGDYQLSPFNADASPRLVLVARKA